MACDTPFRGIEAIRTAARVVPYGDIVEADPCLGAIEQGVQESQRLPTVSQSIVVQESNKRCHKRSCAASPICDVEIPTVV
jgi:hypothetical protein